jgi:hypothetical protein
MTIQRPDRTRRLHLEPLEARDVPSVVTPHADLLRPMGRAEVHKAVHHHAQAAQVHAPAATAASSTPSGDWSEPITGVVPVPMGPLQIIGEFHVQPIGPVVGTAVPIDVTSST